MEGGFVNAAVGPTIFSPKVLLHIGTAHAVMEGGIALMAGFGFAAILAVRVEVDTIGPTVFVEFPPAGGEYGSGDRARERACRRMGGWRLLIRGKLALKLLIGQATSSWRRTAECGSRNEGYWVGPMGDRGGNSASGNTCGVVGGILDDCSTVCTGKLGLIGAQLLDVEGRSVQLVRSFLELGISSAESTFQGGDAVGVLSGVVAIKSKITQLLDFLRVEVSELVPDRFSSWTRTSLQCGKLGLPVFLNSKETILWQTTVLNS